MEHPVLITGGEGFIGRHLQQVFDEQGVPYVTADITGMAHYLYDVSTPWPYASSKFSKIIHLAGLLGTHELMDSVNAAIDVNIKGTVNMLNLARAQNIPFVGITMDHVWQNVYETTKMAAERLAEAWSREYDIPVTYVRAYNAFGEFQAVGPSHPQKIIPTFARAVWTDQPIPIWGNGQQIVDLVYARDVAHILSVAHNPVPEAGVNVLDAGTGAPWTVNEVAAMVHDIVYPGYSFAPQYLPMRKGEHTPLRDPVARMPLATFSMQDLKRTVQWYKDRPVYP